MQCTFTVYVTGFNPEKSFVFEKIVEITSHVRFPIHVRKHIVDNACCIFRGM